MSEIDTRFSSDQKLTLEVTVKDRDEAIKLIGWLYHEKSKVDKVNFGVELNSIGFGHSQTESSNLFNFIRSSMNYGSHEEWLKSYTSQS